MRAFAVQRGAVHENLAGRILCHDIRGPNNAILLRKGHVLLPEDLPLLFEGERDEIHLLELGPDDVGQRQAGQRLAEAIRSAGLRPMPSGHRHVLRSTQDGLLKVDATALQRLNGMAGVAVFTLLNDQVISADQVVAEAQITPLAIRRRAIEAAELIARERPVLRFLPFVPHDVILWTAPHLRFADPLPAEAGRGESEARSPSPRFSGEKVAEGRMRGVADKLRRFGSRLTEVIDLPRDADSMRDSIDARRDSGATLFLISGSNALDPLDPVFVALELMGAKMQRIGVPVHPGTLLWIATLGRITIIGLPSCGLGSQVTAFDLVLPKLLAEGAIRDDELAALGHGGILRHTLTRTLDEEPADEPVR